MIALAAALAAAPFAGAFWGRDLGAVARELADRRGAEGAALFDDLLRLCDCEPLPPLPAPDPLRQLVRVEAARRARLGSRAAASETLWRDVLQKDFFRRDPGNPPLASALRWPDEEEVWTGEVRLVDPPRWRCDQPGKPPPPQDDAPLAESLRASGSAEAAARFAYYRASRLLAAGETAKAAEQARLVDPGLLGSLAPWAALLRIRSGADGPEAAVALAHGWAGPPSLAARALAADHLARHGRWAEIPEIAGAAEGPDRALLQHVRLLRVRALIELSRPEEALAGIPRDASGDLARELALEAMAGRPLNAGGIDLVRALWPDPADAFARLAQRALFAGALEAARSAGDALPQSGVRARLVQAEMAFAAGDRKEFVASIDRLAASSGRGLHQRLARGRAAIELAGALVTLAPAAPGLRLDAAAELDSLADQIGGTVARDLLVAAAALRTHDAASAGVVRIPAPLPVPDLPEVRVSWPEPRSLLAIPDGEGGLRDWFPAPDALAGGRPP